MSHALTESLFHPASVTVPDDGDDLDAASVEVGFQALANRTAFANARLTGALACTGSPLLCNAGVTSAGTITASGILYADGVLYSNGGFVCNDTAQFNNPVTVNANVTIPTALITHGGTFAGHVVNADDVNADNFTANVQFNGKMRRQLRRLRFFADADATIAVAAYDHVSVGNVNTAIRTWNLTTAGLLDGDSCEFSNRGNYNILLKVGGSTIFTLTAATYDQKVRLVWDGSAFYPG